MDTDSSSGIEIRNEKDRTTFEESDYRRGRWMHLDPCEAAGTYIHHNIHHRDCALSYIVIFRVGKQLTILCYTWNAERSRHT